MVEQISKKLTETTINKLICVTPPPPPQFSPYKTTEIRVVIDSIIMDDVKHVLGRAMTKQNLLDITNKSETKINIWSSSFKYQ